MADINQVYDALRKADAAGNVEDAKRLANYIRQLSGEVVKPPPPPEESGFFRQAADVPVNIAKGAATGVRAIADIFGANNPVSQGIKGAEDYLDSLLSAQAKNDQKEIARIMKEAEDKGIGDQVIAGVKAFATAPVDFLSQALGSAALVQSPPD